MLFHAPMNYDCTFCRIVMEARIPDSKLREEVILQNSYATVFLGIWNWPGIPVDVIVIPNEHYENI